MLLVRVKHWIYKTVPKNETRFPRVLVFVFQMTRTLPLYYLMCFGIPHSDEQTKYLSWKSLEAFEPNKSDKKETYSEL